MQTISSSDPVGVLALACEDEPRHLSTKTNFNSFPFFFLLLLCILTPGCQMLLRCCSCTQIAAEKVHICRGSDSIGFSLRRPNFTLFSLTDNLQLLHFLLSTLEKGLHLGSNVPILNNYTQGVQSALFPFSARLELSIFTIWASWNQKSAPAVAFNVKVKNTRLVLSFQSESRPTLKCILVYALLESKGNQSSLNKHHTQTSAWASLFRPMSFSFFYM